MLHDHRCKVRKHVTPAIPASFFPRNFVTLLADFGTICLTGATGNKVLRGATLLNSFNAWAGFQRQFSEG